MYETVGIMDIGSNSIRLVIYEFTTSGEYRVIQECKESARLSAKIGPEGRMEREAIAVIAPILRQFQQVCDVFDVTRIRATATAAIRNAANTEEIISWIAEETGLELEVLSGEEEGTMGFLGVANTMNVLDGILIDIGGGSTEITLFSERERLQTVSFPFGAVNMNSRFGTNSEQDSWDDTRIEALQAVVRSALTEHPWITENLGLPFVGLGGTARTLAKISQKQRSYSLPILHHYEMSVEEIDELYQKLPKMSYSQRKKIAGLSKDRADIIVSGLIILHTIFSAAQGTSFMISGAGLRDGLFHQMRNPQQPLVADPLDASIQNALASSNPARKKHLERVLSHTQQLCRLLRVDNLPSDERILRTASMLYKSGAALNYYQYNQHSAYHIMRGGLGGLSHRETVLAAALADYHPKLRTEQLLDNHRDIIRHTDAAWVHQIGSLLQLAIALDCSESGTIQQMRATLQEQTLHLTLFCKGTPVLELNELENKAKDVQKVWNLQVTWSSQSVSSS